MSVLTPEPHFDDNLKGNTPKPVEEKKSCLATRPKLRAGILVGSWIFLLLMCVFVVGFTIWDMKIDVQRHNAHLKPLQGTGLWFLITILPFPLRMIAKAIIVLLSILLFFGLLVSISSEARAKWCSHPVVDDPESVGTPLIPINGAHDYDNEHNNGSAA